MASEQSDSLKFHKGVFSTQWKFLIHTMLQCMSPKTTSWNEFGTKMASAIICLATNRKFYFSKLVLIIWLRTWVILNFFYMYPRFTQLLMDTQFTEKKNHQRTDGVASHSKNIFANIKIKEGGERLFRNRNTIVTSNQCWYTPLNVGYYTKRH